MSRMDLDRLNRWLTPISNIGVLAGIFLVAAELNQGRDAIRAQTRNELSVQIVDLMSQPALDSELAEILNVAVAEGEMTPLQTQRYFHRVTSMLRYWENVHYQFRRGLYARSEYETQLEAIRASTYVQGRHARDIWCSGRMYYSPEFRAEFDRLLPQPC